MIQKLVAIVRITFDVLTLYVDELRQILQHQNCQPVQTKNPNFYKKNQTMEQPFDNNMEPQIQDFEYTDDGDYTSERIVFMHNTETNDTLPIRFSGEEWKMVHEIAEESGDHPKDVIQDIVLNRLEMVADSLYNDINEEFPE